MRDFKFRAFNESKKIMIFGADHIRDISSDETIPYLLNGFFCVAKNNIMQYIGLKDKNGVDIYEGDIVRDSSNRLMVVEWDNRIGTSRFIFTVINSIGYIKAGRFMNTHVWITSTENDIEVMGNMYENKELLGER